MAYIILGLIGIIIVFFLILHFNRQRTKKNVEDIRTAWGKPKLEAFDFYSIRKYADTMKEPIRSKE